MLQIDRDKKPVRPIRPHAPSAEETAAHDAFLAKLKDPDLAKDLIGWLFCSRRGLPFQIMLINSDKIDWLNI